MNAVSTHHHRLARSAGTFTGATLLSRLLGYARDTLVAVFFGAGPAADAFYTAFRISNLLRRLLGEGAMSASFVPVFSEYTQKQSKEKTQEFLNTMFTTLLILLSVITLLGIVFSPQLTRFIAHGFDPAGERYALTVILTRYMFPFILFISLAALMTGVLNALHSFFLPALAPACLSVAEMLYLGFLWVAHLSGQNAVVGLAISVTVGGFTQFFLLVPALLQKGYRLAWRWDLKHEGVNRVGRLMLPATVGISADQLNAFVDTMLASFLSVGSVTALYYSNRVMQLPLALFGIALSQVALPTMSAAVAQGRFDQVKDTLNFALRLTLFMILPATVGLMILRQPIVQVLFEHGQFNADATRVTSWALLFFSTGLFAYASVKILASAFYAYQNTRTPVRVAIACVGINIVLSLLLMKPMGVGGLALATASASAVNALSLFVLLRRKLGALGGRRILRTALNSLAGCGGMAIASALVMKMPVGPPAIRLLAAIAIGALVYLGCAKLLRMEEWKPFWTQLSRQRPSEDFSD